jgi:hypothetical protein
MVLKKFGIFLLILILFIQGNVNCAKSTIPPNEMKEISLKQGEDH